MEVAKMQKVENAVIWGLGEETGEVYLEGLRSSMALFFECVKSKY